MNIDAAIAKATEQTVEDDSGKTEQTQVADSGTPSNEGEQKKKEPTAQAESSKAADESKASVWDGDVSKLPPELQEHAKTVQRYTTKLQQEAADYRKKLQELEVERAKNFAPPKPEKTAEQPLVSEEEWNDALLDMTGVKVSALLRRTVTAEVDKAKQEATAVLTQVQEKQSLVEWEQRINDFASANPDFIVLHNAGIMKPMLKEVLSSGGTLEEAYTRAKAIADYFDAKAMEKAQGRVNQKKEASVNNKTPVNNSDVVFADDAEDAFMKAAEAAFDKKRIRTKVKK